MNDILKSRLMGWSAAVGLAALGLLGHSTSGQATVSTGVANPSEGGASQGALTSHTGAGSESYQTAQWSPPPPPPPAVGGVRG
jgi:hypothetical protein